MAISLKVGRPRYVADINSHDPAQFYYNLFYDACRDFTYHEMLALSRALNLNIRTMYRWRDGKSYPADIGTMLTVLDWNKAGKPIIVRTQKHISQSMV